MVANHFRWDFIGLSTDDKPTADNPRVADGSTYYESDTSKVFVWYKDRWYEKTATGGGGYELPIASASTLGGVKVGDGLSIDAGGVLSASGGGSGMTELTTADLDFPASNPDGIALWNLADGYYYVKNTNNANIGFYYNTSSKDVNCEAGTFNVYTDSDGTNNYKIVKFEICSSGGFYMGYTKTNLIDDSGDVYWFPDAS